MRYLLSFLTAMLFFLSAFAQIPLCQKNGRYGLCSKSGMEMCPPVYDTILTLYHEDATAYSYYYLGFTGGKRSSKVFSVDSIFVEDYNMGHMEIRKNMAVLFEGGSFDLLDTNGKAVFRNIEDMYVTAMNDEVRRGLSIRKPIPVSDLGLAKIYPVRSNKKWGSISLSGETLIPFRYDTAFSSYFGEDNCLLMMRGNILAYYSETGKLLFPEKYEWISQPITQEYLPGANYNDTVAPPVFYLVSTKGLMGMTDEKGKELIPPRYAELVPYSNELFVFNTGGRFKQVFRVDSMPLATFDANGNQMDVTVVDTLRDSLIIGGKFGIVNKNGKEIIPARYDFIGIEKQETSNALLFHFTNGGKENIRFPEHMEDRSTFFLDYNKYFHSEFMEGGKSGYLDASGKELCPGYDCTEILEHITQGPNDYDPVKRKVFYLVEKNGKRGLLSSTRAVVMPLIYDDISLYEIPGGDFIFEVTNKGKYGFANANGKLLGAIKYDSILFSLDLPVFEVGGKKITRKQIPMDEYGMDLGSDSVTFVAIVGGKYGLLNWSGKEISSLYDTITYLEPPPSMEGKPLMQVRLNNKYGIIDGNGKALVPALYENFTEFYDDKELLNASQDGKWGLVKKTGGVQIPCRYDQELSRMAYSPYYEAVINGKRGLVDNTGIEMLPIEYDHYSTGSYTYGTAKDFLVVEKNKKLGIYDLGKRKLIHQPVYDHLFPSEYCDSILVVNIGATDILPDRYDAYTKFSGGKWGLMTNKGKMLVPVEFDSPPQYNFETGTIKATRSNGEAAFFDLAGKTIANGNSAWDASYIGKRSKNDSPLKLDPEWTGTNGPEGCDATTFYADKKGNYWLGTGSSGGVYFSSNKGKSWQEKNKGIGPMHIQLMNCLSDTLFIRAIGAGYEDPNEEFTQNYYDSTSEGLYFFDPKKDMWQQVKSRDRIDSITGLMGDLSKEQASKLSEKMPMSNSEATVDNYFVGFEYPYCDEMVNCKGFLQHVGDSLSDSTVLFKKGFPKDVFTIRAGNLHAVPGGTMLLSKSGVFLYNGKNKINRLGAAKLIASDVTQLIPMGNDSYFARTGTSDIWFYNGKKWTKLLDAYTEQTTGNYVSYGGYYTGWMNRSDNGNILYSFCGNIYESNKTGKRTLVLKQDTLRNGARYIPLNAARDKVHPENIYGIAFIEDDPENWIFENQNSSARFALYQYNCNSKTLNWIITDLGISNSAQGTPLVMCDQTGTLWMCSSDSIARIENGKLIYSGLGNVSLNPTGAAFGNNGEIAISGGRNLLCVYDPTKQKWIKILTPVRATVDALGFDDNGSLFAGCNYEFEYYCGGKGKLTDPGLFRLQYSESGPVWHKMKKGINERVLSIAPNSKGLAVGTSGSGMCILKMK